MAVSMKNVDLAFQGVGQKAGMDIWRIEDFRPVPLPKSDFGRFYSGDSYIVLQTAALKSGILHYDIHFWLGKDTSQDEAGTAAIKTVELDAALGGRAVQYRELQGQETDKFLSYFKPCIIPLDGGVASGFKKVEAEKYEPCLYVCKGRRVVRVKQVPFTRTSLNHDDVFILDTQFKIYQFNGSTSNIQERAKALQVVQHIKDTNHEGNCDVAIVEDGKLVADSDTGEFWSLFGGFAPIGKKLGSDDDIQPEATSTKLYCIVDGKPDIVDTLPLSKGLLESNRCYLLDCGTEVYVWVGRITTLEDRKAANLVVEEFIASQGRPKNVHITRVIQGFEPLPFRTNFDVWPLTSGISVSEDGRGKVASLLKQQGVNVKGLLKAAPEKEEVPPLFDTSGKLEVWRVNGQTKVPVLPSEFCKFYTGDCYIVLYTYPGDRKDEYFLFSWYGRHSTMEEQAVASRLVAQMANSFKGRPVQGRILEGKEPAHFLVLFHNMFIFKGGLSSGYKKQISDEGAVDDTYKEDTMALIQVRGTAPYNTQSIQVDLDAASLNSCDCFILQTGSTIFLWNGSASAVETQQIAAKMGEILKPSAIPKVLKEGSEPATFWNPLGGKKSFTSNKREVRENGKDPRLFACDLTKAALKVTEVYNFTQDDLLSEDVMILDTYAEIFVWVGHQNDTQERQEAFEIAQKYIDNAASAEGLPKGIPIYKVTEGNEPFFFTRYFENWDPIKAAAQGSSFEKRLSTLFGHPAQVSEAPKRRSANMERSDNDLVGKPVEDRNRLPRSEQTAPTQRAAAMAALSSAFSAANKSDTVAAYRKPIRPFKTHSSETSADVDTHITGPTDTGRSDAVEGKGDDGSDINGPENGKPFETGDADHEKAYISYERLKTKSADPAPGIDPRKRESYLSPEDFRRIFGMDSKQFCGLPRWKQDMHKKAVDLF